MQENEPGLRERQRQERLARLHEAAYRLADEGGLAAATVDAITSEAGLSRRTFFNYYASKEDAILGLTPLSIPDDALAAFYDEGAQPDRLLRTVHLVLAIGRSARQGSKQVEQRRGLMARFPELAERQREHGQQAQELILTALSEKSRTDTDSASTEKAKILILLAGAVLRIAYDRDPRALDGDSPAAIDAALSTFRSFMKEI